MSRRSPCGRLHTCAHARTCNARVRVAKTVPCANGWLSGEKFSFWRVFVKNAKNGEKTDVGKLYNRQSYPQVIHRIKSEARKDASRLAGKACIYKSNQVEKVRRILGREAVAMAYAA